MKTTLSTSQVADALRADQYARWSYYGAQALAEYLEQYEEDGGTEIELDVIALRCEYSEYASALEAMEQYQPEDMPTVDLQAYSDEHNGEGMDLEQVNEEQERLALEWLEERTTVIPFSHDNPFMEGRTSGVIIQQF